MGLFLTSILLFLLGACIGSFLNVLIYRTEKGEDWVKGRSHCENCDMRISWYDNIPLFSYLLLRGQCRGCKTPISKAHPIVESLIGVLFVWWWLLGSLFFRLSVEPFIMIQPLFWLIIGILLIYILVEDVVSLSIHLWSLIALSLLAVSYRFALVIFGLMKVSDLSDTYIAALLITAFFYVLSLLHWKNQQAMGMGDVLLAFPIVILLGWPRSISWVFLSFVIGAVIGIGLLAIGKARFHRPIAFGPFMILATGLALIWGEQLWTWYSRFL